MCRLTTWPEIVLPAVEHGGIRELFDEPDKDMPASRAELR